jgi:hypothetical protein
MNRTALTSIAPEIFRKRLLVEGYFQSSMGQAAISGAVSPARWR